MNSTKAIDMTGRRYGKFLVIREVFERASRRRLWLCRCDCGKIKTVLGENLRSGGSTCCGCNRKSRKHGNAKKGRKSVEYKTWVAMRSRCTNPNATGFKNWGGRGIKVCERWQKFENFLFDMGRKPSAKHSIDRFPNNNGDYEPSNCRWSTRKEQALNTRKNKLFEFGGKSKTISEWALELNIHPSTIATRIKCGWSLKEAFSTPVKFYKKNREYASV